MREATETRIIYVLCIILFVCKVSTIFYTGIRSMFPVYVYGNYDEKIIWEEVTNDWTRTMLPVFAQYDRSLVAEKRKDMFRVKHLEEEEILTLMGMENSGLGMVLEIADTRSELVVDESTIENLLNEQPVAGAEVPMADLNQVDSACDFSREKVASIELAELADYETLVKRFYTIDAITNIGAEELNAEKLGNIDMTLKQTADQPQILIYHTHSQEGYADSVKGDDSTTIMGVGEHLKEILEQEYGYNVIHHMGKYDVKTRDSAYSRSLPEIKKLLQENPTIEVVIDLHRDAVAEDTRLVMDIDGRPTAKFMFFNGISRTTKNGRIDYLANENLEANLAFSFQAKWKAEEYYPGLTRRNYLNAYRYNMHLRPKTMLLELGAQNNTLEEAMNACDPIAHILHMVLSGEE